MTKKGEKRQRLNLLNRKFGKLKVIKFTGMKGGRSYWECRCKCGTIKVFLGSRLNNNGAKSCGCICKDLGGLSRKCKSEYDIWKLMLRRCNNKKIKSHKYYGGRGIKVCKRWYSFKNFLNDMGIRPKNTTLDRVDNNGNYCKRNCRWVTMIVQGRNKRNNVLFTINGQTKCLSEWAEIYGHKTNKAYKNVWKRVFCRGWGIEKALTEPLHRNQYG